MNSSVRQLVQRDIYNYVSIVESCISDSGSFLEVRMEEYNEIANRLQKPDKISILHEYIFAMIRTYISRDYRKNSELYDKEDIDHLIQVFSEYGLSLIPLEEYEISSEEVDDGDMFYRWFLSNEDIFMEYWEKVTEDVFHIVFSNRRFLLQFSQSLAEYVEYNKSYINEKVFDKGRKIKRCNRLPIWLKKAVFYRDHGRCVFCLADLSGLLATDRKLHFDHIIPLARWGTNDPSNFQLLCKQCNLKKSCSPGATGLFYVPWWA
ncbi:HNH endonuclease [Aeromonas sp. 2692-1]|nr:HNH endonuclease [Aeromonas sp. 2692-1]